MTWLAYLTFPMAVLCNRGQLQVTKMVIAKHHCAASCLASMYDCQVARLLHRRFTASRFAAVCSSACNYNAQSQAQAVLGVGVFQEISSSKLSSRALCASGNIAATDENSPNTWTRTCNDYSDVVRSVTMTPRRTDGCENPLFA